MQYSRACSIFLLIAGLMFSACTGPQPEGAGRHDGIDRSPEATLRAFQRIENCELDHQEVRDSVFFAHLDEETRQTILSVGNFELVQYLPVPPRIVERPRLPEGQLWGMYPAFETHVNLITENRFLHALDTDVQVLKTKLDARDNPEQLRQAVLEVPEMLARLSLLSHLGSCSESRLKERHQAFMAQWAQSIHRLTTSRTNRPYAEAKTKILNERGADYERFRLVDALHLFCANLDVIPNLESLRSGPDTRLTYELVKDYYPTWSEAILTAYNSATADQVSAHQSRAEAAYRQLNPEWGESLDLFERSEVEARQAQELHEKQSRKLEALELLARRAGVADQPEIVAQLADLRSRINLILDLRRPLPD